ncbi:MAG: ABC transporter substrate-binding protein [Clostridia bacterium]|nr:ABC transporter substrate-binding protein [Clostridia bacterium]
MDKYLKKLMTGALAVIMIIGLTGCKESKEQSNGDIPTLNWYLRYDEQDDQAEITAKINEITEKEIGCHVNIVRMESGDYNQKLQLALFSGEQVDICHMAPRYGFYSHVSKNAFLPLDDLIKEYASDTYKDIPERFWDAAKIDGKIYGIPNYQIVGRENGFVVLKSLLEKYNFDLSKVEKLEDMEPFFEAVKNGEDSNMKVFANAGAAYEWGFNHLIGFDSIGNANYPCVIRNDDDSLKVINQFETEEFMNYCKLMRKWYNKGYIPAQGSNDNLVDLKQQGLVAAWCDNVPPGYIPNFEKQCNGRKVEAKVIDPPFVNTANVISTMNCVGANTKYPEKCVQFINLVNQNVDDIYNILCYGIEGKHFNKVGENRIEKVADSGYDPNVSWEFGNNFNAYLYGEQEDNVWEETAKINEEAIVSKLLGFSLNTENIKTEIVSCEAVAKEYLDSLVTGAVDPEALIPEFLTKLKSAGCEKVIAEAQKQVDEWKAGKN